ncbi:hypothetical protein ABK040_011945 [Willaertia magna]
MVKKENTEEQNIGNSTVVDIPHQEEKLKHAEDIEIKDPLEPPVKAFDMFTVFKIFGLEWLSILVGLFTSGCVGAVPIMFYFILGDLIDSLTPTPDGKGGYNIPTEDMMRRKINELAMWFGILAAISLVIQFLSSFLLNWANERIGTRLKKAYFDKLVEQEIAFFDIKKTGVLTAALSDDVTKIAEAYTIKLGQMAQFSVQCILGIILAFTNSWKMSLVMISTSPLIGILIGGAGKLTQVLTKKTSDASEHASGTATEVISCIRTVRSMAGEEYEKARFAKDLTKITLFGLFKSLTQGFMFGGLFFCIWGTCALAFWYGGGLVADMELSIGGLMQVFGQMLIAVLGLGQATAVLPDLAKARVAAGSLLKVINRKPAIDYKGGKTLPNGVTGNVRFENVVFNYPSRPNVTVLKNFSFEIKPGQSVALVGPSGSGKSTIVGLVEKFYTPNAGRVFIDGVDVAELDPQWLHKNIGIVTQEPILFATTIAENIAYAVGFENVTQEQIEEAAKAANAHNFIIDLPEGYKTRLGEKGVSLSGGQKQRIAIARAVLQNPHLLLLDEATSALDTESEALVQAALDKLMQGRTSICIAHRLSTVQNCDVICVLHKGELKEVGKHQELLQIENGIYRKLAQKQMMFGHGPTAAVGSVQNAEVTKETQVSL